MGGVFGLDLLHGSGDGETLLLDMTSDGIKNAAVLTRGIHDIIY